MGVWFYCVCVRFLRRINLEAPGVSAIKSTLTHVNSVGYEEQRLRSVRKVGFPWPLLFLMHLQMQVLAYAHSADPPFLRFYNYEEGLQNRVGDGPCKFFSASGYERPGMLTYIRFSSDIGRPSGVPLHAVAATLSDIETPLYTFSEVSANRPNEGTRRI